MKRLRKLLLSAVTLVAAVALFAAPAYADLTISTATQFSTLDGGVDDADGLANGCFTYSGGNLIVSSTGSILNNDPVSPSGNSAGNICAIISGGLTLQGGASIQAQNNNGGGAGGNIQLTVGGSVLLESGSTISSHKGGGSDNAKAGDIAIVANGATSDITIAQGATIEADSRGQAGAIDLEATRYITIDGTVRSGYDSIASTTNSRGGPITIKSGCTLTVGDTGIVSSEGRDAGADLVHLEGCDVFIYGLVQSTGPAHSPGNQNNNNITARDCYDSTGGNGSDATRPDKPWNSTACVEIWAGGDLVIDSTGTHNGEIDVDTALSGGTQGRGWIDLIARGDISIIGDNTGAYAVHANQPNLTNSTGGVIKIQSTEGAVSLSGQAVQANAPSGSPGGGTGGSITVQAASDVDLDTAVLQAQGDSNASGGYGVGGTINISSANGLISWLNGEGNVQPTGTDDVAPGVLAAASRGTITLQDCVAGVIATTGTSFPGVGLPATTPTQLADLCGVSVTLSSYVQLPPVCQACSATPTPTPSATPTPSESPSPSPTPTPTPTVEPSPSPTPVVQASPDPTPTPTPTVEPSPSPTPTPTVEPSPTPTPTPVVQVSPDPTPSPSATPDPCAAGSTSPLQLFLYNLLQWLWSLITGQPFVPATTLPCPDPTPTPTPTVSPTVTPTPVVQTSPDPSPTPTPTVEPSPSPTPDVNASPDPSPSPSSDPSPDPTPTPQTQASPDPTPDPTPTPVIQASPDPTPSTPGQQATPDPDPSSTPGGSAFDDPSDPSDPGAGGTGSSVGVAPTSFADTGALQSALPGLMLLVLGAFSIRRWRQIRR